MDFQAARKAMVNSQVRPNDVTDLQLQLTMEEIPREIFLPSGLREQAYVEREHLYGEGDDVRAMIKPRDFAKLINCAAPRPEDLVLEIGCGTGYCTAVMANLSEMVVAVEPNEAHRLSAQDNLSTLKIDNAAIVDAPLLEGAPDQGPFDLIIISMAISAEPEKLLTQLKPGGRLATIWIENNHARGCLFYHQDGTTSRADRFDAGSRTPLEAFNSKPAFRF